MPDRTGPMNTKPDPGLAEALRRLPDAVPQPDLWPQLAHALQRRQAASRFAHPTEGSPAHVPNRKSTRSARRRWLLPAACAAVLALAVLLPRGTWQRHQPEPVAGIGHGIVPATAPTAGAEPAAPNELALLHRRSQALERWIGAASAHAPQRSRDLMASVEIEDLVGLVDVQLGAPHTHDEALLLWRQRVALLEDLATIRGSAFVLAANGADSPHTLDAPSNRIN